MGKESKKSAPKPQAPMTKRQLTRFERERRLQRIALAASAFIIALVIIIPSYGLWKESRKGEEPAARVAGKVITNETYAKVLGFRQAQVDAIIQSYQDELATPSTSGMDQQSLEQYKQLLTQQIQQLQMQKANTEMTVLDDLIDNELIRLEAARRGITVTPEEVDQYIVDYFAPSASTGEAGKEESAPSTPTTETPTPTPTPQPTATPAPGQAPLDKAKENLNKVLALSGLMTDKEYRTLIAEPAILETKVEKAIGDEVPTTGEQVHVRHILLEKEEDAKNALARLQQGADFDALAKEISTDTATKDEGGDLGWFPRGVMDAEFEKAAFAVNPGQIYPEVVQSSLGYHVIKGEGHETDRPISDEYLPTIRYKAYTDWLQKQRSEPGKVEYAFGWENIEWARNYIAAHAKATKK